LFFNLLELTQFCKFATSTRKNKCLEKKQCGEHGDIKALTVYLQFPFIQDQLENQKTNPRTTAEMFFLTHKTDRKMNEKYNVQSINPYMPLSSLFVSCFGLIAVLNMFRTSLLYV